jgi:hypothetical protein
MSDIIATIILGLIVVLIGGGFAYHHMSVIFKHSRNASGEDTRWDHLHFHRQYRRRMHVSVLLIIIGFLIPVCDWLITSKRHQSAAVICLMAILLTVFWIVILAIADMFSTRRYQRYVLARLHGIEHKHRELETHIEMYNAEQRQPSHEHLPQDDLDESSGSQIRIW